MVKIQLLKCEYGIEVFGRVILYNIQDLHSIPLLCPREAAVAEWYRYRIMACLVTSSSPVPLKTRHEIYLLYPKTTPHLNGRSLTSKFSPSLRKASLPREQQKARLRSDVSVRSGYRVLLPYRGHLNSWLISHPKSASDMPAEGCLL
ncbi:hypothetical protein TNCV_1093571 [Trichonephila clavipes]|nr:hypothetical protein TNCV_1093571 [Trichonephila clavipes]